MKIKKLIKRSPVEYFGVIIEIKENHKYIATDEDGSIFSYERKPSMRNFGFYEGIGDCEFLGEAKVKDDEWKESLRKVR